MECPLCGHLKVHKRGKMPSGVQRYFCLACHQTFNERFDSSTIIVTFMTKKVL
ncbi:MAG: IS1 family transposase [Leptolyngbyaceae cyanobacterium SU_3_3]|nr:IS1 family transposase [Leptolyngbyaceae cyanobacterium SU_3_3]